MDTASDRFSSLTGGRGGSSCLARSREAAKNGEEKKDEVLVLGVEDEEPRKTQKARTKRCNLPANPKVDATSLTKAASMRFRFVVPASAGGAVTADWDSRISISSIDDHSLGNIAAADFAGAKHNRAPYLFSQTFASSRLRVRSEGSPLRVSAAQACRKSPPAESGTTNLKRISAFRDVDRTSTRSLTLGAFQPNRTTSTFNSFPS